MWSTAGLPSRRLNAEMEYWQWHADDNDEMPAAFATTISHTQMNTILLLQPRTSKNSTFPVQLFPVPDPGFHVPENKRREKEVVQPTQTYRANDALTIYSVLPGRILTEVEQTIVNKTRWEIMYTDHIFLKAGSQNFYIYGLTECQLLFVVREASHVSYNNR